MSRLSLELKDAYPYKFIWWMECDLCQMTRSDPKWTHQALLLSDFTALGWKCGKQTDMCPDCLSALTPTKARDKQ